MKDEVCVVSSNLTFFMHLFCIERPVSVAVIDLQAPLMQVAAEAHLKVAQEQLDE